jgi:hypothetical protein
LTDAGDVQSFAEFGLVALFHAGQTGVGAGTRADGGVRLKYSDPMCVDDVAVDFPDMPIILAHPSFPWQDEALSVATHKPQVNIDLPKYFPPQLVQYANSLLRDKVGRPAGRPQAPAGARRRRAAPQPVGQGRPGLGPRRVASGHGPEGGPGPAPPGKARRDPPR